ncbi:glycosyltransferase family 4 protein [candidate division TA06 bacterium]|uniref:Glycosyltransferase family 4 protein n=1 Tax=candidate division TA06 bacterium TaxID=2250710 RepID=A0A933MKC2_UNCT6|nr:glycosyltransferase family 4 protein [candidate division TA06 bacterium]
MKVLFFDHSPVYGGAEQSLLSILPALKPPIAPVLLVLPDSILVKKARELKIRFRTINLSPRLASLPQARLAKNIFNPLLWRDISRTKRALADAVQKEKADLVYANTLKSVILLGLCSKKIPQPQVWHIRDIVSGLPAVLLWRVGRISSPKVIAVSRVAAGQPALKFSATAPTVIHNGIDQEKWIFDSRQQKPDEVKARLGIKPGESLIGVFGQLSAWKGQEHAIQALAHLKRRGFLCKLLLAGDAIFAGQGYPEKLKSLAGSLNISEDVIFSGWLENAAPYMMAADIIVHTPVKPEPFGRVLIEAMALGKPVVAIKNGGIPEIIDHGRSGLLLESHQELPFVLERLLCQPAQAKALGDEARRQVELRFKLSDTVSRVSDFLTGAFSNISRTSLKGFEIL